MAKRAQFNLDTKDSAEMVATGKVAPVNEFNPNAAFDAPRVQEKDEHGVPLWFADFLIDDDEADRAQCVAVKIASHSMPQFAKYQPVAFDRLTVMVYVNKQGQLGLMFEGQLGKPAAAKAA